MSETNRLLSYPAHPVWASLSHFHHHPQNHPPPLLLLAGVVAIAHVLFW